MQIIEDKIIKELIDGLKYKLRKNNISSNVTLLAPRFVFVCGKEIKKGQNTIRKYTMDKLEKFKIQNDYGTEYESVLCIISEYLYVQDLSEDIFSFEQMLAEISDRIIIVAESPGTFCELGAFAMDKKCRDKIIVINEEKEEYKDSFITKGPIKMLENRDENSVILHSGFERLKFSSVYNNTMKKIAKDTLKIKINYDSEKINLKSLMYELANIIEIFQPLEDLEIEMLYKIIKNFETYEISNTEGHKIRSIKKVLMLMERIGLIKKEKGYYTINRNISCYNILFKISRKEFNDIRINYINRINKCQPQRMEIL